MKIKKFIERSNRIISFFRLFLLQSAENEISQSKTYENLSLYKYHYQIPNMIPSEKVGKGKKIT